MSALVASITLGFRDAAYSWPLPVGTERVTVAGLKEELGARAKVLYHQKLRFKLLDAVLEDTQELPLAPTRIDVGGPDSIVNMLEMHLQKVCELRTLPATLWERLGRCGRLPACTRPPDAAILVWLGDYLSAREHCKSHGSWLDTSRLREALVHFSAALPGATEKSEVFRPVKADRDETQHSLEKMDDGQLFTACGQYSTSDGVSLGYVFLSLPPRACGAGSDPLLLVHWGGNGDLAARSAQSPFRELVKLGLLRVVFADYRGYGWSSGSPSLATLRGDAKALFLALPSLLLRWGFPWPDGRPLVVMGRSLGSLCALYLAALYAERVQALVLDSPISCHWPFERVPTNLWTSLGKQLPPLQLAGRSLEYCTCCRAGRGAQPRREAVWLDNMDLMRIIEVPTLVLSAAEDDVCPLPMVLGLFESSTVGFKKLVRVEGKCHDTLSLSPIYWNELKGFLHSVAERHH